MRVPLSLVLGLTLAATPAPPAPVRLLALGDSFTAGTGSTPEQSFPARLAARWRAAGRAVELENLGVNGYSTVELIDRELPRVKAFAPTRVTLAIGANDIVRHPDLALYRERVRRIFAALLAAGIPGSHVWVLPQPDWALSPASAEMGSPAQFEAAITGYNAVLRDEATAVGATYVDLWSLMQREAQSGALVDDGLHPSAKAYDEWAGELARLAP